MPIARRIGPTLVAILALALGSTPLRGQDVAVAEAALAAAQAAYEQAFDEVENLALDLEDDYDALVSGPDAPTHRNAIVLAITDSLAAARSRIGAREAQGRRTSRANRHEIFVEVFADPVRESATVDPRLALWVADGVAVGLSSRADLENVDADHVLSIIDRLFDADEGWFDFWNRAFYPVRPEVRRYVDTLRALEEAQHALERARHPERYGPRGEAAPPGMVVVPGGKYTLGPNNGWSRGRREVTLSPFALDRHEVTNGEYRQFLDELSVTARQRMLPRGWSIDGAGRAVGPAARSNHPVVFVSWEQASAYAQWAGKRLPTEDEWEAAAGGLAALAFPWGNEFKPGRAHGAEGADDTVPVESFPRFPSAAGCFDMAGNVWEWTATLEDGSDVDELPKGVVNVVIRGGGYDARREELATRYRWTAPGQGTFSSPRYDRPIGFRCAQDL